MSGLNDTQLMIIVFVCVLALMGIGMLLLGGGRKNMAKRAEKVARRSHGLPGQEDAEARIEKLRKEMEDDTPFVKLFFSWLPSPDYLKNRLQRTGLNLSVRQYLLLNFTIILMTGGALFYFFELMPILAGLVGVSVGVGIPHFYTGRLIRKRMQKFLTLFPDAIELIVRGLRSGLPVGESFYSVAEEIEDPVSSLFTQVNDTIAIGVSMEDALEESARRLGLTEFDFFVTSIKLQRETGGNLAEILANLAESIRSRLMMHMKVKALSSEAKASAVIVGALPIFIVGILSIASPDYLRPLYEDVRGNIASGVGVMMMLTGSFIMAKMAQFEI